ncbi:MAG TPA: GNAT family N-acetyltransferase [Spirochaetia bacterium]|nr:GNAT family N-acetyltransferase [Spirochaetia bacterium]
MNPSLDGILIRPAGSADAADIARHILLSAPLLLPAVFGPGITGILESLAAGRGTLFSHEHALVAVEGGRALGTILGYTGATKAEQDPRTGFALLRFLGLDMVRRLGTLLRMQSAIGRMDRDEYYISNVAVSPDRQGQGIGGRLVEAARRGARLRGARAVILDVETDNPGARRLYERLGFSAGGRTPEIEIAGRAFAFVRMTCGLR